MPPKQFTLVCDPMLVVRAAAGWVIVTFLFVVHPLASVTVQVHVPAVKPMAAAVFCAGVVFQLNP